MTALSFLSGNAELSRYLEISRTPGASELTIFCGALSGASLGFLWYNAHPAEVFMGDVGALALGGGADGCAGGARAGPLAGAIRMIRIFLLALALSAAVRTRALDGAAHAAAGPARLRDVAAPSPQPARSGQ